MRIKPQSMSAYDSNDIVKNYVNCGEFLRDLITKYIQ